MKRRNIWVGALIVIMLLALVMPQIHLQAAQDLIEHDSTGQDLTAPGLTSRAGELTSRVGNYDIRDDQSAKAQASREKHRQKLSPKQKENKAGLARMMRGATERLAAEVPGLSVRRSSAGSAELVAVEPGRKNFLTGPSADARENIVRSFMRRNAGLYNLTTRQVAQLKKIADYSNPAGNLSWVELRQEINGLPVFQGELRVALTRDGEIARTVGRLAPVVEGEGNTGSLQSLSLQSIGGASSAAEAVAQAAAAIGVSINATDLVLKESAPDGTSFVFEPGPFADEIKVEAIYFPIESGLVVPSWSMVLWQDVPAYYTIVDRDGGDLLWRKNITNEQTQSATYNVYAGDSPAPISPSNALPGLNVQGVQVPRTSFTLISEHPSNNLGWLTDGATTTTGNNADAGLDIVAPNGIDAGGRPVAANRVFNFDYNPAPGLGGALGSTDPADATYRMGAVTNLFFWTNRYHDRVYELGFTEAARNFQVDNFGRGGLGNDRVRAEAQDFSGTNNANFSTPADGQLPRMQMFMWPNTSPRRDGDVDNEIVLHELTHGTSNRLHANASGLASTLSRGMGEGWSDFYARSILSSADEDVDGIYAMGAYATHLAATNYTNNAYYAIRRFPYAVKTNVGPNGRPHNPLTFADTNPNTIDLTDGAFARGPFGAGGRAGATSVHNVGEIWCMALFEVRARVIKRLGYAAGNQRMLQLVTDAMKLDPVNPTLIDGRNSLLAADAAGFNNEDVLDIWEGFATRGIGFGATMSITNVNGKESFDNPMPGMGAVAFSDASCNANGTADPGEDLTLSIPLTNPLPVSLTGVTASVGGTLVSYGSLAPGQTVTQQIPFQVPSGAICGDSLTVTVIVESNLGQQTKTFTIQLGGQPNVTFSETFDGVTAPALPANWSALVNPVGSPVWSTVNTSSQSAPNAAFVPFAATTRLSFLQSPFIPVTSANARLTFRHSYNSEFEWDGGILQISLDGGTTFTDILDSGAGARMIEGGFPYTLISAADGNTNLLSNRPAWTGNSGGFVTTTIQLPAAAAGKSIRLRWIAGSDSAFAPVGAGWTIDNVALIEGYQCSSVATTTTGVTGTPVQYSDQTTLSATVSSACASPTGSVQFSVNGNPVGSVAVNGPGTVNLGVAINLQAGNYPITATFVSSNPFYQGSSGSGTLAVSREDATVTPSASSPTSVKVNAPGGTAGPITLSAAITEVNDASPGNISNAVPVTFTLTPIGPGSSYTQTVLSGSGGGVGGTLNVSATFTNVAVNVYDVTISIGGNFYTGSGSNVLAVFDPSLGFVTGGGRVVRNGITANFGFSFKYLKNGNPQGSFTYIEHRPTGDVKIKSNNLQSLSIAGLTGIVLGKASVNDVGNHTFRLTVVDNGEPGSSDQFGLQITSPNGAIIPELTFSPITISGGNIQVPHN